VADVCGPPGAPTVLLLRGGGQTRHAWGTTAESLALEGWRAIALDLPGHGDSDWLANGNYSIEALAELMCRIWREVGSPLAVVGASLGGLISMAAVGRADAPPIAALVLVDIAPRIELSGVDHIQAFMRLKPEGFASLEEVAQAIGTYQPHRRRPPKLDGLGKNVRLGADGRYHWHWDPRYRAAPFNLEQRARRLEACSVNLRLPTLLVRGGLSDVLSEAGAQEFLALCPTAEYVNVTLMKTDKRYLRDVY